MPIQTSKNVLTKAEVALVKAMLEAGSRTSQEILAFFSRPGRSINPARLVEVRRGKRYAQVAPASVVELSTFLSRWPEHDYVTGLHPDDDELVVKAREAMLNAIGGYNNPRTLFRTECFIVLAVIAWTYLLHWHYGQIGVDFRSKKEDGSLLTTTYGAVKHWELETCMKQAECPLDPATIANLRFLISIRHEIEHQMTRRIDSTLSAKVQACVLNFNDALKRLCGERSRLDRDVSIAIQLVGMEREQRNMLLRDMDLPPSFLAAQAAFERDLPEEITRDERYAWRVMMVHRNTNSKGAADEMVEFIKPGSEIDGEIQRVLVKELEKKKYLPTEIVKEMQARGFPRFKQHEHTLFVKETKSRDASKPFGTFVDIKKKDWRWYGTWLTEVLAYCEANQERFGPLLPSSPREAGKPSNDPSGVVAT